MKQFFRGLMISCLMVSSQDVSGQNSPCEEDPFYQLMDFWIGKWHVYDRGDQLVGTNTIDKILNGCAVMEHWESAQGGKGKSLFYVDNNSGKWKQVWVTEDARQPWGQKEKTMIFQRSDSILVFQGSYLVGSKNTLDRTILRRISEKEVEQEIQVSQDGGLNWRTTFLATYRK